MRPVHTVNAKHLQEYIESVTNLPQPHVHDGNEFPFITISRQAGAGGHTLAEAVIKEMEMHVLSLFRGWQILDQELCKKVMEDPQLKSSMKWLLTEHFERDIVDYLSQVIVGTSPQIAIYHKIGKLIRSFATVGKVIVVGRAGAFLTRDLPLGIHVRLVAPKELRVRNMMNLFQLSKTGAELELESQDASRALLVRTYFNKKDIDNPLHYDMVWNTDRVPIPAIASFLIQLVKQKYEHRKIPAAPPQAPLIYV